jgi:hypothetical protein
MTDLSPPGDNLSSEVTEIDLATPRPTGAIDLFDRVASLIEQGRRHAAAQVNAAMTMTYWQVGRTIDADILAERRADYGKQVVVSLGRQLTARYGSSYGARNLRRMIQFARQFPDEAIVTSLMTQLSWTHLLQLLPLNSASARRFYADQAITHHLSVRELQGTIARKAYERREIANSRSSKVRLSR